VTFVRYGANITTNATEAPGDVHRCREIRLDQFSFESAQRQTIVAQGW